MLCTEHGFSPCLASSQEVPVYPIAAMIKTICRYHRSSRELGAVSWAVRLGGKV